jgi:hypothetical protein
MKRIFFELYRKVPLGMWPLETQLGCTYQDGSGACVSYVPPWVGRPVGEEAATSETISFWGDLVEVRTARLLPAAAGAAGLLGRRCWAATPSCCWATTAHC